MSAEKIETITEFAAELGKVACKGDEVEMARHASTHRYERIHVGGIEILANGTVPMQAVLEITRQIDDILERHRLRHALRVALRIDVEYGR